MILTNSDCQVISGIKSIVLLFLEDFLVADQSKWIKGAASLSLPMYSGLRNSVQQTFSIWMSLPQAYHLVKWLADWEGERERWNEKSDHGTVTIYSIIFAHLSSLWRDPWLTLASTIGRYHFWRLRYKILAGLIKIKVECSGLLKRAIKYLDNCFPF